MPCEDGWPSRLRLSILRGRCHAYFSAGLCGFRRLRVLLRDEEQKRRLRVSAQLKLDSAGQ